MLSFLWLSSRAQPRDSERSPPEGPLRDPKGSHQLSTFLTINYQLNIKSLLTSISLRDGQFDLLPYHQERMRYSRWECGGLTTPIDLVGALAAARLPQVGWYKVRVLYGATIERIECTAYVPRPIRSLRLVPADALSYSYKYADRSGIESLFAQRGPADDVLLVQRGLLTDTSYANIALWDGASWYTPHPPLLRGVRRDALLDSGQLHLASIHWRDLGAFSKIRIFNTLLSWEEGLEVAVEEVCGF